MIHLGMNVCTFGSSTSSYLVEDNSIAILSITREDFLRVLANYQGELRPHDDGEQDHEGELHCHDLEIRLDESDTRVPVECVPGIKRSDDTTSSDNLGDDLAAEASIEGNDSLNVIGEKGGLHTCQGNVGWNNNQKCKSERECEDAKALQDHDIALRIGGIGEVIWGTNKSRPGSQVGWKHNGKLLSDSEDSGWASDLLPCLNRWNAAEPWLWAWIRDHDVCPGQRQCCTEGGCDDGSEEEGYEDREHL